MKFEFEFLVKFKFEWQASFFVNFRPRDQLSVVFCQIRQGLSKLTKKTGFYVTYFPSVWFPAVARLVESGPSHVELQGGSTIVVAAMSKDRLDDELLLVVLSNRQRIGADRIVDERAKVMDMSINPLSWH